MLQSASLHAPLYQAKTTANDTECKSFMWESQHSLRCAPVIPEAPLQVSATNYRPQQPLQISGRQIAQANVSCGWGKNILTRLDKSETQAQQKSNQADIQTQHLPITTKVLPQQLTQITQRSRSWKQIICNKTWPHSYKHCKLRDYEQLRHTLHLHNTVYSRTYLPAFIMLITDVLTCRWLLEHTAPMQKLCWDS